MIAWNNDNYLMHYGVPRRSGRYKWGSGKDPYHHGTDGAAKAKYKTAKKANRRARLNAIKSHGRAQDEYSKAHKDYKQAKQAYKQTDQYKKDRRKKIAAIAAGTTAAAAAVYLAKHPEARQKIQDFVSAKSKSKSDVQRISDRQDAISAEWSRLKKRSDDLLKDLNGANAPKAGDPMAASKQFAMDKLRKEGRPTGDPMAASRQFAMDKLRKEGRPKIDANNPVNKINRMNKLSQRAASEGEARRAAAYAKEKARKAANKKAQEEMFNAKKTAISNRNARTIGYNRYIKGVAPRPTRNGKIGTKKVYDMYYETWDNKDVYGRVPNRLKNTRGTGTVRRLNQAVSSSTKPTARNRALTKATPYGAYTKRNPNHNLEPYQVFNKYRDDKKYREPGAASATGQKIYRNRKVKRLR